VVLTPSSSSSARPFGRNGTRGPSMESQHQLRALGFKFRRKLRLGVSRATGTLGLCWLWLCSSRAVAKFVSRN
jgi:hypothetical protein